MYIADGALVLGLHDLDHIIGAQTKGPAHRDAPLPGSDWFLRAFERSGELFLAGLVAADDSRSLEEQLSALGVVRIVLELGMLGMLNPGGQEMTVLPLS